MTLGEKLRKARRKTRKRQRDIADEVGCSQVAVQGWESGKWLPDLERCPDVAKAYAIDSASLITLVVKATIKKAKAVGA